MSLLQLRNVNFGRSKANATGSTGVGYTIQDTIGATVTPRTTSGVYQSISGSGVYNAYVSFPDNFHGSILWDTGTAFTTTLYATEEYNVEQNDPRVASIAIDVDFIKQIEGGRWRIVNDQMIFYRDDNGTEVARFDLYDQFGAPSSDTVFERVRR